MSILDALDRPIAFHRVFVELTGSVNAALMLSQAAYWSKRTTLADGWFYKTQEEWTEETGLTRYEQEGARKVLRSLGFWEEKKVGIPSKLNYRLKVDSLQTSMRKTSRLDWGKPADCDGENQQALIAETTAETTAEIKDRELKGSVKELFKYYIEKTERNPKLYSLTDQRLNKGLARLKDCLAKTDGNLENALELMRICIESLAASEFHMGTNDRNKQYIDWIDHLFKTTEKLEWWLAQ